MFCIKVLNMYNLKKIAKNFLEDSMKKHIILTLILITLIFPLFIFTGCSSGQAGLFITKLPNKIVYLLNEEFSYNGLKVEALNTDGTTTLQKIEKKDVSSVDTSTFGEKVVTVTKSNHSTAFNIYVANVVITPEDNVREKLENCNDGDVVYFKQGEYKSNNNELTDLTINKKISIVGDGDKNTIINGNFVVGAEKEGLNFKALDNFENVKIIRLGFNLNYKVNNSVIKFDNNMLNVTNGAISGYNTKNLYVESCSFKGFANGITMNNADGLSVVRCKFDDLLLNGIEIKEDCKNTTIYKNVFTDIAKNVVYAIDDKQQDLAMISLGFNQKGNKGVLIAKNTFTRMAQKIGKLNNFDDSSLLIKDKKDLTKLSYINNSSIILLYSNSQNNLQSTGVILSANNYGEALQNIKIWKDKNTQINQSGIIINEDF